MEPDISLVNTESLEGRAPPDALVLMADGTLMFCGARTDAAAHMSITDGATVRIVPDRAVPAARLVEVTLALRAAGAMSVLVVTQRGLS